MTKEKKILIINGPNLNMLGQRDQNIYGKLSLDDIESICLKKAKSLDLEIDFKQSNLEGEIVNWIQAAPKEYGGIIINAAGYTHSSVAIMDALDIIDIPIIEVHISNIYKREDFRHQSFISKVASGVICGFGAGGYSLALDAVNDIINNKN